MTAGRKLRANVYVFDPEAGRTVMLRAGQTVPSRLRDAVTNPRAFEDPADAPAGFGEVEQSGPYVGLSRAQMAEIATARGLTVPDGADTATVLGLVVDDDQAAAQARSAAPQSDPATVERQRLEALTVPQLEAEAQQRGLQVPSGAKKAELVDALAAAPVS